MKNKCFSYYLCLPKYCVPQEVPLWRVVLYVLLNVANYIFSKIQTISYTYVLFYFDYQQDLLSWTTYIAKSWSKPRSQYFPWRIFLLLFLYLKKSINSWYSTFLFPWNWSMADSFQLSRETHHAQQSKK